MLTLMPIAEQRDLVMKLVGGFRLPAEQRVCDLTIPLAVIIDVARSYLETSAFFHLGPRYSSDLEAPLRIVPNKDKP